MDSQWVVFREGRNVSTAVLASFDTEEEAKAFSQEYEDLEVRILDETEGASLETQESRFSWIQEVKAVDHKPVLTVVYHVNLFGSEAVEGRNIVHLITVDGLIHDDTLEQEAQPFVTKALESPGELIVEEPYTITVRGEEVSVCGIYSTDIKQLAGKVISQVLPS